MLVELAIRNFALIDGLTIRFTRGLNVLTGETGAGKSIVLDALSLLLGERAAGSMIRKGSESCEVTGTFEIKKRSAVWKFLESLALESGEESLIIRRAIDSGGRTKSFINDKPVSVSTLASLGDFLADLHGQHEHQLLLKQNVQRELLDRYGECEPLAQGTALLYSEWRSLLEQKNASRLSEQERSQKIDLYRFQVHEIDEAKLQAGDEAEIERTLPQLKNSEKLQKLTDELLFNLSESEGSVLERLEICRKAAESIQNLEVNIQDSSSLLEQALIAAKELARQLGVLRGQWHSDPSELDALISKLDRIAKLKKKYGASIEDVLAYRAKSAAELETLENYTESLNELEEKIASAYEKLIKQCKKLSLARKKAGEKFSQGVKKELGDLGFKHAQFFTELVSEKDEKGGQVPTANGLENVEFRFSANLGEDPKPLRDSISGGELSRLMLAVKNILAENDLVSTLVFDEIDAGIGGSTGNILGEKLKALSKTHQVVLVTHLPQIAAFADCHFLVRKAADGKTTKVFLEMLEDETRIQEVARMLGGVSADRADPTPVSLKHATELLSRAK